MKTYSMVDMNFDKRGTQKIAVCVLTDKNGHGYAIPKEQLIAKFRSGEIHIDNIKVTANNTIRRLDKQSQRHTFPVQSLVEFHHFLGTDIVSFKGAKYSVGKDGIKWVGVEKDRTEIEVCDGTRYIDAQMLKTAFKHGDSVLKTVTLPKTITTIPDEAFLSSTLEECNIPETVDWIGNSAFYGSHLEEIYLPDSVSHLGIAAFDSCGSLRYIRLPNGLKRIKSYTFNQCTALTHINLPDSLWAIEHNAFSNSGIKYIEVPMLCEMGIRVFADCTDLESVKLPPICEIPESTFENCVSLKSVDLSLALQRIHKKAFSGCKSLTELHFSPDLERIDEDAFADCTQLRRVVFESIDHVAQTAFSNCYNLREVIIPKELEKMKPMLLSSLIDLPNVQLLFK